MRFALDAGDRRALLATARESIASHIEERKPLWPPASPAMNERCGAFVSLHEESRLRGCIGRMVAADPLVFTVRAMAKAAAFEDPRFRPLDRRELDLVRIEITALSPLRRITDVGEIEVGRHGLYITKSWHSGVLLPQVATECGFDRDTFLDQVCHKAGLPSSAWRSPEAVIQIFEGLVFGEDEALADPEVPE